MEAKVENKKGAYLVASGIEGKEYTQEVEGYRVNLYPWASLFTFKGDDGWSVTEVGCGRSIVSGFKTRKAAIESAVVKLTEIGEAKWIEKVSAFKPISAAPAPVPAPAPKQGLITFLRVKKGTKQEGHYVGRGSALGNPYRMKKETDRIPCILKYRAWLWAQLKDKNSKARAAVSALVKEYKATGKLTLICYCPPLPCHSEVIANAVRYYVGEEVKKYSWVKK